MKDWLSKTSSSFVASFASGFLLLLIGAFFIHKGTSRDVTKKTVEPLKSVLEGVHVVSSDILGVRAVESSPKLKNSKSKLDFGLADEPEDSFVGKNTVGADVTYVAATTKTKEDSQ